MPLQDRNRVHWCLKMVNVPCEEYALCSQLGRVQTVQCALLWLTYILFANIRFYQCIWIFVSPVLHWRQLQVVKKKHLLVSLEEALLWRFAVKKLNQQHPMEMMLQEPQNEADRCLSQMKSRALWWYTSETGCLNWPWKERLFELEEIFLFHKNACWIHA